MCSDPFALMSTIQYTNGVCMLPLPWQPDAQIAKKKQRKRIHTGTVYCIYSRKQNTQLPNVHWALFIFVVAVAIKEKMESLFMNWGKTYTHTRRHSSLHIQKEDEKRTEKKSTKPNPLKFRLKREIMLRCVVFTLLWMLLPMSNFDSIAFDPMLSMSQTIHFKIAFENIL